MKSDKWHSLTEARGANDEQHGKPGTVRWWVSHQRLTDENERLTERIMKRQVVYKVAPAVRTELLKTLHEDYIYSDDSEPMFIYNSTNSEMTVIATSGEQNAIKLAIRTLEQNLQTKQTTVAGKAAP